MEILEIMINEVVVEAQIQLVELAVLLLQMVQTLLGELDEQKVQTNKTLL